MNIKTQLSIFGLGLGLIAFNSCKSDDSSGDSSACEPENISYSTDIIEIFETKCTSCHGGTEPEGEIDLKIYDDVKTLVDDGRLVASITQSS